MTVKTDSVSQLWHSFSSDPALKKRSILSLCFGKYWATSAHSCAFFVPQLGRVLNENGGTSTEGRLSSQVTSRRQFPICRPGEHPVWLLKLEPRSQRSESGNCAAPYIPAEDSSTAQLRTREGYAYRTSRIIKDMSSLSGPRLQAVTPSRIVCFIAGRVCVADFRTNFAKPSTASIS